MWCKPLMQRRDLGVEASLWPSWRQPHPPWKTIPCCHSRCPLCSARRGDFRPDVDLGQIAARCACGVSVSASPRMIGAPSPRTSRAGTSGSAGDHPCARPSPARLRSTATTLIRPPATQRDQGATGGSGARPLSDIPGTEFKSLALDALQPAGSNGAQSAEKYYNKEDCLAAINAVKSSGSAPVRER